MAITVENPNLVRQKVKIALMNARPDIQEQFKDFFQYHATQGGNADLEFVPFSEAQADDADGTGIVDAACKVVAVYAKKNSSATDAYLKFYDSATVDTTASQQILAFPLLIASEQIGYFQPGGISMANGVTVTQHTDSTGSTDASEGGDGFILIKAA